MKTMKGSSVVSKLEKTIDSQFSNNPFEIAKKNLKEILHFELDSQLIVNETELQNELLPRIIDAIAEIYDDRSDYKKGFKAGYVEALKRVLGDE